MNLTLLIKKKVVLTIPLEELTIQSDKKESGKEIEIEEVHEESHQEHQEEPLQLDISSGQPLTKEWRYNPDHPKDLIICDPSKGVTTITSLKNIVTTLLLFYKLSQ